MTLTLYKCADEKKVINKTKTDSIVITGTLKEPCDLISPVLKVAKNSNILSRNYCFIDEFSRYYFIEEVNLAGAYYELTLSVDVLDSFYNEFKDIVQVISRQEFKFNVGLVDNELPLLSDKTYQRIPIGTSPFNVKNVDINGNTMHCFVLNACNDGGQYISQTRTEETTEER